MTSAVSPKVSVIIPNYNHARYLPQRIESVLGQSYKNLEVILMDDCSPDNSRGIITHYAGIDNRIRVVFNEQNSGSTFRQWNKGFGLAQGQYIWIAESDDYAEPNLLQELVARLEADAEIGLAYCHSAFVDETNQQLNVEDGFYTPLDPLLWRSDFVMPGRDLITTFMSYQNIIPNASAVVIRKSLINRVGKADETFKVNGDWLFWASLMADVKVAFVAKKLNYFRQHLNNARSKINLGLAITEMITVAGAMRQYGTPNSLFFDKMLDKLYLLWFEGMILNELKVNHIRQIFRSLKLLDNQFNSHLAQAVKQHLLSNKLSGIRQYLGDGVLYKLINKNS